MRSRSLSGKIAASLLTLSMLACGAAIAQSTDGGSAGDGDKPLNPANKTYTGTDPKDTNGDQVTVKKPHMHKRSKQHSMSSSNSSY